MVWLNVFIVPSSKLFGVTIQNGQSRYQWSCWVCERASRRTSMHPALKWYLEKPLCFQENSLNLQVRPPTDPSEFLLRLRETFRTLKPTTASCHSSTSCFVHTAFKTCSHVFVRVEGLEPSLTAPYQGPFEVLSRTDKHFTIKINDRTSTISIDRLKPAFLLNDTDSTKEPFPVQKSNHPVVLPPRLDQNVPIPATTRSGRKVRFNLKYL
ncbi:gag-Pol polyprotein [Trichonephila inaurata madagascariensis]|uniref:Gag-Pol polyprotein n=1 Tax=Trichonephila inaurata madagascariensis TaxID=2747483 RepID=A0A8X6M9P4_9ARAC|nr:gag-Pol polyprotein [Trichonephila inaurata madagascariensis]